MTVLRFKARRKTLVLDSEFFVRRKGLRNGARKTRSICPENRHLDQVLIRCGSDLISLPTNDEPWNY